jgi:hypothetical protein
MESGEDGLMDLLGGPTADVSAAVQKSHLQNCSSTLNYRL